MEIAAAPARKQRSRGERFMFSTSDDTAMLDQIRATHMPDGRDLDVKLLLQVANDIFERAMSAILGTNQGAPAQLENLGEQASIEYADMIDVLAYTIHKIYCEISCKTSGGDTHAKTLSIFNNLSSYGWEAKVALALAAFAMYYGEFWLVAQLYAANPLAKSVAILKQLPEIMERSDSLKPKYEAISNLTRAVTEVIKCMVEFKELPAKYITPDTPAYTTVYALIPTAAYWTIRSIVACASQILGLTTMSSEQLALTTEAWELSSLAYKVNNIYEHLTRQLALCSQHIDEKKHAEAYETLVHLFETPHLDNIKILKALINATDDQQPLAVGSTKERVSIDVLRKRHVLLLISDLDISPEECFILTVMYQESRDQPTRPENQYELVWIPFIDRSIQWTEGIQQQFETLQSTMLWYTVYHPSLIHEAVIRYIKDVWHYNKRPILVVLDPQGRVVNTNAIHMLWIWGSMGYPFTSAREEELWKEETWRLELLADATEPMLPQWVQDGRYICLYGGEDMHWIEKFTTTLGDVAEAANIPLEMLYVGKSNIKEKIRRNNSIIADRELSHTLQDLALVWYFWVRLESMWHSKMQYKQSVENDPIMQEIMTMLSYDGSEQGWAVISRWSAESPGIAKAKGDILLTCLNEFGNWKTDIEVKGFIQALIDYLKKLHTPHHCNQFILPGATGNIPEKVVCAECGRSMEKFIMYRCCTD